MTNQLFITVKYGENREEIFNPHCKSLLLVECIREKCHCDEGILLDLIDETGTISNLSERSSLTEYASQFLEGRKKYVLLKVTKSASPDVEPNKYESLLKNIDRLYPDLAEKIERLSKPSQQTTKGKQWLGSKKRLMMKAKSAKRNSIKP